MKSQCETKNVRDCDDDSDDDEYKNKNNEKKNNGQVHTYSPRSSL
jgi:hypothetical protein